MTLQEIQKEINTIHDAGEHVGSLSDGYHSFDDLYDHRMVLTAALFRNVPFTWKSKIHEDGTMFDGDFIVGVTTPDGFATYHYGLEHWDKFRLPELPHAPVFDGHTPEQAMARILKYFARGTLQYDNSEVEMLMPFLNQVLDTFGEDDVCIRNYLNTFGISPDQLSKRG